LRRPSWSQDPEAEVGTGHVAHEEGLEGKVGQVRADIEALSVFWDDGLGGLHGEAAAEDGGPKQDRLLCVGQQLEAPVKRGVQRAMTEGAPSAIDLEKLQMLVQLLEHTLRAKRLD
jgi:hypothetical protein